MLQSNIKGVQDKVQLSEKDDPVRTVQEFKIWLYYPMV